MSSLFVLLTVMAALTLMPRDALSGLNCFTGDGDTLRRKKCPEIGKRFTDRCFKTMERLGPYPGEIQRGCFNSKIASWITNENQTTGCLEIKRGIGGGFLCLCETDLCNHANPCFISKSSHTTFVLMAVCLVTNAFVNSIRLTILI